MASGVQQIFTYNQVGTITNLLLPHIQNTPSGARQRAYKHLPKHPPTDTYTHTPTHTQKGRAIILIFCLWFWIKLFVNYTPWAPWTFLHISVFCANVGHANGALPLAAEGPRYLKMAWKLSVHISVSKPFSNSLPFISKCQRQHTRAKKSSPLGMRDASLSQQLYSRSHHDGGVSVFQKLLFSCAHSTIWDQRFKNDPREEFSKRSIFSASLLEMAGWEQKHFQTYPHECWHGLRLTVEGDLKGSLEEAMLVSTSIDPQAPHLMVQSPPHSQSFELGSQRRDTQWSFKLFDTLSFNNGEKLSNHQPRRTVKGTGVLWSALKEGSSSLPHLKWRSPLWVCINLPTHQSTYAGIMINCVLSPFLSNKVITQRSEDKGHIFSWSGTISLH